MHTWITKTKIVVWIPIAHSCDIHELDLLSVEMLISYRRCISEMPQNHMHVWVIVVSNLGWRFILVTLMLVHESSMKICL